MFKSSLFLILLLGSFIHLLNAQTLTNNEIKKLIDELAADDYKTREQATIKLSQISEQNKDQLYYWLKRPLEEEQRLRIELILTKKGDLSALDRQIIDKILESSSGSDFFAALNKYGLKMKSVNPSLFLGSRAFDISFEKKEIKHQEVIHLTADLGQRTSAWIVDEPVHVQVSSKIPFPKVYLNEHTDQLLQIGLSNQFDDQKYISQNNQLKTNKQWRRLTSHNKRFTDVIIDKRYIPGTYHLRVQAWNPFTVFDVYDQNGERKYTFNASEYRFNRTFTVNIDPFEDIELTDMSNFGFRAQKTGIEIEAVVDKHLPQDQLVLIELSMTPYWYSAQSNIILPDFEDGKFITVFWRRIEKNDLGVIQTIEKITDRRDLRDEVQFLKNKEKYISLWPTQKATRLIPIKTPKNSGLWELIINYGAFSYPLGQRASTTFANVQSGKKRFLFPIGVCASPVYQVEIH